MRGAKVNEISIFILFLIAVVIIPGSECQLYQYGIGATSQSYANYVQLTPTDLNNAEVAQDLINSYNNLGGMIQSLSSPSNLPNCLLNQIWSVGNIAICGTSASQCLPSTPLFTSLAKFTGSGNICLGQLDRSIIGTVSSFPTGTLAIFRSSLPPGCNSQCVLHGTCQNNGDCTCPSPTSNSSVRWVGQNCARPIPPAGNSAYFGTLSWKNVDPNERFDFSTRSPCQVYVSRMPTLPFSSTNVPVSNFFTTPYSITFFTYPGSSSISQLDLSIYLINPTNSSICGIGSSTGASHVSTVLTLTLSGQIPIIISPNIGIFLNPDN